MWLKFKKCLFCKQDLPENPGGLGEHVIPLNLFGFWCSHDICGDCINYFGLYVDKLGISNPHILKTMELLKVDNLEKKYEQLPFVGEDVESKEKVAMVRKRGDFKAKAKTINNVYLECSEKDFDYVAVSYIKSMFQESIPKEILLNEIEDLKKKYFESKPGETINSLLLGLTLKKRQLHKVEYDFEKIPIITPLIAKIVFTAIHYFLPLDLVGSFRNYWQYRDHARYEKPIADNVINNCILQKKDLRFPFHAIRFMGGGHTLMVDCMFFGYNNWRCLFNSDKETKLFDHSNTEVDLISYYMDFSNLANKKKFIEYTYLNKEKKLLPFEL